MNYSIVFILCCIAVGINAKSVRLTNHDLASPGEFPYQVSLQLDGRHLCGGSLIGKKHVLTAAHCVHDFIVQRVPKSRIKVVVGTTNIYSGTKMDVDRVAQHGAYQHSEVRPTLVADVAVIRLKNEITESATVKTIALPSPMQELPPGTELIVSGFGASVLMGPVSPVLKKMKMHIVDSGSCQAMWSSLFIQSGHMCATLSPGNGICQGDSGGPLTLNKHTVVGIVSAVSGSGCGTGIPDIFTKVSHYLDFINSEISRNY